MPGKQTDEPSRYAAWLQEKQRKQAGKSAAAVSEPGEPDEPDDEHDEPAGAGGEGEGEVTGKGKLRKDETVALRLDPELREALEQAAEEEDISLSVLIRDLLRGVLEDPERLRRNLARKCRELAEALEAAEKQGQVQKGQHRGTVERLRETAAKILKAKPEDKELFDL